MKELFERYTFPALVAVMLLGIICSLGVIHWNRSELHLSRTLDAQVRQERTVLAGLKEKIQAIKEQEAIFLQRKTSADISLRESEKSLAEVNKLKLEVERKISRAEIMEKEKQETTQHLKKLQIDIAEAKATLADLQKQQSLLSGLKGEIRSAVSQKQEILADLEKLQKEHQKKSAVAAEYHRLNMDLSKGAAEYKIQREAIARLQGEHQTLLKKLTNLQKQNSAEQKNSNLLQQKIKDLQKSYAEAAVIQTNIEILSEQQRKIQEKNTALESEKLILLREITINQKQLTSLKKELELAQHAITNLQKSYAEAAVIQKNIEILSEQQRKIQEKNTALESEKSILLREVTQSRKQFSSLKKEVELAQQTKAELAMTRAQNHNLHQENLQLQAAVSTQRKILSQLSEETAAKQSELELAKRNLLNIQKQQEAIRRKK